MATQRVPALQFPSQTSPEVNSTDLAVPSSFQEALRFGWTIVKEETTTTAKGRERKGVVLLESRGTPMRLRVPYTATRKEWVFGKPEPIE
jgi:hypothetical protein